MHNSPCYENETFDNIARTAHKTMLNDDETAMKPRSYTDHDIQIYRWFRATTRRL